MNRLFSEIVDVSAVQQLMENLWRASGLPAGILDVDGQVLVAAGWQEICTRFHRRHPQATLRCRESDGYISRYLEEHGSLAEGEFVEYRCRNGLVDVAVPIVIGGRHLATLFLGQFLYEPPDEEFFRSQARQFGFPEADYLAALRQVPIFSRQRVRDILAFHTSFVNLLTRLGTEKLQRLGAEQALLEKERRISRQNEELLRMGAMRALGHGRLEPVMREILEATARTLEVERVGVWLFAPDRSSIRCLDLYESGPGRHSDGQELAVALCPAYFQAVEGEAHIAADDAVADPRTRELAQAYLLPSGISSMLDTAIWVGGKMTGILCCEHVGPARRWTPDERNFVGSMADLLAVAMEGEKQLQTEAALRESEEIYRLLFAAESDAILIYDAETLEFVEVNQAAAHLYGFSRDEFARLRVTDISAEPEASRQRIREAVSRRLTRIPLALHRRRDGTAFPVEISHGTFEWKGRRMCVGIVRDISERQQIMKMKDEMLSAVSHEIRTPLTAIIGFADFLREHELAAPQRREYLDIIACEGERLKELTDNLLDLQRLRAGFGAENFQEVAVMPLLKSVVHLFSQASTRHQLVIECRQELPSAWGDERQLYRALQNLLANAIKYSPGGGRVGLGARLDGDFLTLWVQDEGIGIPGDAHEQIFERFFRVSHEGGRKTGGTGLGLALVKAVARTHRGRVWVESAPGEGSTFYLSLPLRAPAEHPGVGDTG